MFQRKIALAFVLALPFTVAGCEASIGSKSVKKTDAEKTIAEKLTAQFGSAPNSVTCPNNLKAKVGESMDCDVAATEGSGVAKISVTEVKGSSVNFDIEYTGEDAPAGPATDATDPATDTTTA
jgi:hypothetical protein